MEMNSRGNLDTGGIIRHGQRQMIPPAPFGVSTGVQRGTVEYETEEKKRERLGIPHDHKKLPTPDDRISLY
jgi:hypothetical protein